MWIFIIQLEKMTNSIFITSKYKIKSTQRNSNLQAHLFYRIGQNFKQLGVVLKYRIWNTLKIKLTKNYICVTISELGRDK